MDLIKARGFRRQTGEDWFFIFQDNGAYGRVVHLQPMICEKRFSGNRNDTDGDGTGEPVLRY